MDEARQEKALESLRDWNKWVLGLDVVAVAGCVLILENGVVTAAVTPFLLIAIVFFALCIFSAVLLIRELAHVSELLPLRDSDGGYTSVFQHRLGFGLSVGALARLQMIFLGAAAFFFLVWLIVRSIVG